VDVNPAFEIIDYQRFRPLLVLNAQVEQLFTGMRWAEGPVWFADAQAVLVSDLPNNRILRWVEGASFTVFREPCCNANGNTRDRQGRLVTCENGSRRVTRTEFDGTVTVLADQFEGKRFNSPNDVIVRSDGSIWFTDPDYGILADYTGEKAESEIGRNCVFRLDPSSGALTIVTDELVKPNGLAFSPDEKILYLADSGGSHMQGGPHHILAYDLEGDRLCNGRVFAEVSPGLADGFRIDVDGNLWTSAGDGVHCYAPDGALIGKILVREAVANVVFGGRHRSRLFIAASTSLYAVYTGTRGAAWP
jgi:gluconolactonase